MKTPLKIYAYSTIGLAAVFGAVVSPVIASAASDAQNTTINATLGSTISMTTSSTVAIGITPVSGGSQSSASDTVTVNSNNAAGYDLTLSDSDATLNLANGANTITPHAGTPAVPTALANNTWGWAVPGGNFDGSYSVISNATSSSSKWAGISASGSAVNIKSTATVATDDVTTVWYSAKADTSKPNGVYTDAVTYTATTK